MVFPLAFVTNFPKSFAIFLPFCRIVVVSMLGAATVTAGLLPELVGLGLFECGSGADAAHLGTLVDV